MTQLTKCSPLPRRQPRKRNNPSHAPLMIISGEMGHIYNVVLANKGTRTPCYSTKLPTSDGRLTGYIIVSFNLFFTLIPSSTQTHFDQSLSSVGSCRSSDYSIMDTSRYNHTTPPPPPPTDGPITYLLFFFVTIVADAPPFVHNPSSSDG